MNVPKLPGLELKVNLTGADCRCKVENDGGRMSLPAENMVDDCPLHGKEAVERMRKAGETRGPWKQTYLGVAFYPLDPQPADIRLGDIAHALALTCRFGGHCRQFYCPAPETRVLTDDLQWKPAGDLRAGDLLLGFDENPPAHSQRARRQLAPSRVLIAEPARMDRARMILSDGTELVSSTSHQWLVTTKKSRNLRWLTVDQIAKDVAEGKRRYMLRFLPTWPTLGGWDAGYLAGMLDGEGHVSFRDGSMAVGYAQNPGPVIDHVRDILRRNGVAHSCVKNPQSECMNVSIRGGWAEQLRLMGTFRANRLIGKFRERFAAGDFNREFPSCDMVTIDRVIPEGRGEVVSLGTTSRTFFAEGFGSHNSVAQHSVHVSQRLEELGRANAQTHKELGQPADGEEEILVAAMWGLMHDAAESYVGDLIAPIRALPALEPFRLAERVIELCITTAFGLPPDPPAALKSVDVRMLYTEARDLMKPPPQPWGSEVPTYPDTIVPWGPTIAEAKFLDRFHELEHKLREHRKELER